MVVNKDNINGKGTKNVIKKDDINNTSNNNKEHK